MCASHSSAVVDGLSHGQFATCDILMQSLPLPAIATDIHGTVRVWNRAAEQVFGWTAEEIVGRRLPTVPPNEQEEFDRAMRRILTGETVTGVETRRRRRDGRLIDVRISASPLRDSAGSVIGPLAIFEAITQEKLARAALARQTDRVRSQAALLDLAHDAIFVRGLSDRKLRFWNSGAEDLYGWPKAEVLGHDSLALLKTEFPLPLAEIETILYSIGRWNGELIHTARDGRKVVVESRWALERDHGAGDAVLEINTDVTERRRAEALASETQRRLQSIFNQTFQFIGLLSPEGTLIEVNSTALKWIGATRQDVVGRPFWDTPWWNFSSDAQEHLRRAVVAAAKGAFVRYEIDVPSPQDGSIATFDFSITPVRDDDGQVVLLIPEGRDITERKRFERALTRQAAVLRTQADLLNLAQEAILICDPADWSIVFWNRGAERLLGWTETEILGQVSHEVLQTVFPQPLTEIRGQLRDSSYWEGEVIHVTRDGRRVTVVSCWAVQRDVDGKPKAILMTNHDITVRKEAEDQVRRLNRELHHHIEELGIAYEQVQAARDELARWNAELECRVAERTREIQQHSRELTGRVLQAQEAERKRIARDLHDDTAQSLSSLLISLDLVESGLAGGEPSIHLEADRARAVARRTLDSVRALAHGLRPTILDDFGLDAALEWIAVDHTRTYGVPVTVSTDDVMPESLDKDVALALFRIGQEALTNSGKHAEATAVTLRLTYTRSRVKLVVADNGRGFDVNAVAGPSRAGGLGLHGMRERVELIGGKLDLTTVPGRGTRITVWAPLTHRVIPGRVPRVKQEAQSGGDEGVAGRRPCGDA